MTRRVYTPSAASLKKGAAKDAPLTKAIEACELLYASLKWAAHTQGIPNVKDKHLNESRQHIVTIVDLIGTGE